MGEYESWRETLEGERGRLLPIGTRPTVYVNALVAKTGPTICFGLTGYNSGPAQFVQLHDEATLPADGAVPETILKVGTGQNFSVDYGPEGRAFLRGVVVCNSSTGPTKTIGAADCWFDVIYC